MSAATQTPTKRAYFAADKTGANATFRGHKIEKQSDGSAIVRGIEVFKAGTFRDSMGEQHTWTADHLNLMVANFNLLRETGIFADVPVRRDHSFSIEKVMGYFEGLSTDGALLRADVHVTEPDQLQRLERGTYRSVSLEVGAYETNDGAIYWPVVFGVAYVDIPAVEGLHSKNLPVSVFSLADATTQETSVSGKNDDDKTTIPDDRGAPRPAEHSRPTIKFRIEGTETDDVHAVQAHINKLETFAKDTMKAGRFAFVSSLVSDHKIAAPQKESMETLVEGMSDAQFEAFKASYASAPSMALFANHGTTGGEHAGPDEATKRATEIKDLEDMVDMHRRAGMKPDALEKTSAFRRLQTLTSKS